MKKRIRFFPTLNEDGSVAFSGLPPLAPVSLTLYNKNKEGFFKIAALYLQHVKLPKYIAECRLQGIVPKNAMTIQDVRSVIATKTHLVINSKPIDVKFYVLSANDIRGMLTVACVIQDEPVDDSVKKAFSAFVKNVKEDFTFAYKTAFTKMLRDNKLTMQKYYRMRNTTGKR